MIAIEKNLAKLDSEPFQVTHNLAEHPQLSREEISQLVLRLPSNHVNPSRTGAGVDADIRRASSQRPIEIPLAQALDELETSGTFILVREPENDPLFAEIYVDVLADIEQMALELGTTLRKATLFLFISSPGGITPFHLDRYSAFLFQLQGHKQVHIWKPWEHDKLSVQEIESFASERLKRTPPVLDMSGSEDFHIHAGEGVHIPFMAPHWVENSNEVSLSMSVHFNTSHSLQKLDAMCMNDVLRNWTHTHPRRVSSQSGLGERLKAMGFRQLMKLREPGRAGRLEVDAKSAKIKASIAQNQTQSPVSKAPLRAGRKN